MPRRFPPHSTVVETSGGWRVDDASDQALAFVHGRDDHSAGSQHLSPDEARRIARNIAKLTNLLKPGGGSS